jgi:lysophospholipase L1-like esterase
VLCAASLALTLLALEAGLRAFWGGYYLTGVRSYVTSSATRGWANTPSTRAVYGEAEFRIEVTHNALGFRGPELQQGRAPGSVRVLVLGDSFAYGIGVADDETFSARLAEAVPRVEVLNAGVNGYGTGQELLLLREYAAALRPDLVVVAFFWNDVANSFKREFPSFRLADGSLVWPEPGPAAQVSPPPVRRKWLRHSYLYRFGSDRLKLAGWWLSLALGIPTESRDFVEDADREAAWKLTAALIRAISDQARAVGARTAVLAIPDQVQVQRRTHVLGLDPRDYAVQPRLRAVCEATGIPLIDPLPELRADAARGALLYYPRDRHLTERGHRIVARVLEREFQRLGLLGHAPGAPVEARLAGGRQVE